MRTALIIHGYEGHAGIHWQQWLHDELEKRGYKVLMPEMPAPDQPDRQAWLMTLQQTLADVNLEQLTMIGHSLGVVAALDFIEQASVPVNRLLSVAGFAQDYGAESTGPFLRQKTLDLQKVRANLRWAAVVYGDNDPYVPQAALQHLANDLGVQPVVIAGGGHLNTEAGFAEFPRLLELLA